MSESSALDKILQTAVDANARYYSILGEFAGSLMDSVLSTAGSLRPEFQVKRDSPSPADEGAESSQAMLRAGKTVAPQPAVAPTMVLEGPAGASATGFFVIQNKLQKKVTRRVEFAPLLDPSGKKVKSGLVFHPGKVTLGPGQQVIAKVTARISPALAADVRYHGEIRVPGMAGARIPIAVVRTASASPAVRARAHNSSHTLTALPKKRGLRTPSPPTPRKRASRRGKG
jgi:hypothetical protein